MKRRGTLWGLALPGIVLLGATGYIVYYTLNAGRPRSFWRDSFPTRANIFDLPGQWRDDSGAHLKLSELRGSPAVLSFVYLDCAVTCPRIMHDLKRVDAATNGRSRFVLFLFDDRERSVADMRAFRKRYGIAGDNWKVLWGPPDKLKTVADVFELVYTQGRGRFEYEHTNFYAVVNSQGRVRREIRGLVASTEEITRYLRAVLE